MTEEHLIVNSEPKAKDLLLPGEGGRRWVEASSYGKKRLVMLRLCRHRLHKKIKILFFYGRQNNQSRNDRGRVLYRL